MDLCRLEYLGTRFHGSSGGGGVRSVESELLAALRRLGEVAEVEVLSRTDAGVHARGQVAVVSGVRRLTPERLARGLHHQLPDDLRCAEVARVDARPRVVSKTYRYGLDMSHTGDPFVLQTTWRPPAGLVAERLHEAAGRLSGRHDFKAFRRRGETRDDLTRSIFEAAWSTEGPGWCFTVRGEGFCYRLVRSLVGGMVAVARGTTTMDAWDAALRGTVTPAAREQAPARGLLLSEIRLDPEPAWWCLHG